MRTQYYFDHKEIFTRAIVIRNENTPAGGRTNNRAYISCALKISRMHCSAKRTKKFYMVKKTGKNLFLQSPLKTKDFIFLLFFLFFFKKGGSNFLKTAYLFSIQPTKNTVTKTFRQNPKSKFRRKK